MKINVSVENGKIAAKVENWELIDDGYFYSLSKKLKGIEVDRIGSFISLKKTLIELSKKYVGRKKKVKQDPNQLTISS